MVDTVPNRRWFQVKLRDMLVATLFVGIACGSAMMSPVVVSQLKPTAPVWTLTAMFSLLAAFWSLQGRYRQVAATLVYVAVLFLLMFWLRKEALFG